MPSVAEQLRQAREAQGLSLQSLAEMTKIRSDHLEALEAANYDPFPAPVYIRGSVRTCANFLHLDTRAILEALDRELSQTPEFSSPPSLSGEHRGPVDWVTYQLSRVNWRVMGVLAAVLGLIAGGYYGWNYGVKRLREDPLSRLGPGIRRSPAISEADLLPIPTNPPAPVVSTPSSAVAPVRPPASTGSATRDRRGGRQPGPP